jgi:hypothetical protein
MYKYYLEIESEEHFLNCYELGRLYNIYTEKDKPHARFVSRLLKEYCNMAGIEERFYYKTAKGMMLVWPACIYKPVLNKLIEDYPHNEKVQMEFSNKTHTFVIGADI